MTVNSPVDSAKERPSKMKPKNKKKAPMEFDESELTEKDLKKKEELDQSVRDICDLSSADDVLSTALTFLADDLRTATDSVTSVPKALKFLRPHFDLLAGRFETLPDCHNKRFLADILSVLATTITLSKSTPTDSDAKTADEASTDTARTPSDTAATESKPKPKTGDAQSLPEKSGGHSVPQRPKMQCLKYRIQGGVTDLVSWGQEYTRNLTGEIISECAWIKSKVDREDPTQMKIIEDDDSAPVASMEELTALSDVIIPFNMARNAETDAIDLAAEMDAIHKVPQYVDINNFRRVTIYLCSMAQFAGSTDEFQNILSVAFDILLDKKQYTDGFRVALRLDDRSKIETLINSCKDAAILKQLAMISLRQRLIYPWGDISLEGHETLGEELTTIAGGDWLSSNYLILAKELDVLEPKLPEDVYKSHLEERRADAIDSAKQNLAATLVNAFVNVGFCKDKLMTVDDSAWLYKNKDHGMTTAAASLGVINLWNVNQGLAEVDKLQWSHDVNVKSGAFMAFGLFNTSVRNEWDPAFALLSDHLEGKEENESNEEREKVKRQTAQEKIGAIMGLGFAYAACRRPDILELLIPLAIDVSNTVEIAAVAALSLGLIFVGSCNEYVAEALVQTLIERSMTASDEDSMSPKTTADLDKEESTEKSFAYLICVGLGLVFFGRGDLCEATLTALEVVGSPLREYAMITLEGMAFAGSGDVIRVQRMLRVCAESRGPAVAEKKDDAAGVTSSSTAPKDVAVGATAQQPASNATPSSMSSWTLDQAVAVLNIPLIAMGEETGSDMVLRIFDHLLQYAGMPMRRAVPLALALHSPSNPKPQVIDTLSKLSHDPDAHVALRAILALGIVGAGTNNSRAAGLLRQLASYYSKDPNALFTVRIAQGMLYMGKGLVTISPLHSDKFLLDPAASGCLVVLMHICLNMKKLILGRHHHFLFYLVPAIYPRMLVTVDEDLQPLPVMVRVGQNVDVVGQAGCPKTITGFQTHTTPVLLAAGERAELAADEYESLSPVLEGLVILRLKKDDKDKENAPG